MLGCCPPVFVGLFLLVDRFIPFCQIHFEPVSTSEHKTRKPPSGSTTHQVQHFISTIGLMMQDAAS